jgi:AbrB family looped-hinge helix DNA binding protein
MKTELKVDSMGRVVLPKPLRKHFGLRTGSLLGVRLSGDHIELTPKAVPPGLREVNGLLVHEGRLGEDSDWVEAVRDERDRRNWGL